MVSFGTAVERGFNRFGQFSGRATRAEYWWWLLLTSLLIEIAVIADAALGIQSVHGWGPVRTVMTLILLVPSLAVAARRLHDTEHSGWWLLFLFVPCAGQIILLVLFLLPGTVGSNKYGTPSGP